MADRRGTKWREEAAKLEAQNQQQIQNPMQALPNDMTSIDKAHAVHGKGDGGTVDQRAGAPGQGEGRPQ